MNKASKAILHATALAAALAVAAPAAIAQATCTQVASGLRAPMDGALTPHGRLLVSETGTAASHSGRVSIIEPDGQRRTLIDGLPSGINDTGGVSGPTGLLLRGRTLYLLISVGDVGIRGRNALGQPVPGSALPNPNGPSSPLFSSLLAIHFSAEVERSTQGFTLQAAHHQALADGEKVVLDNGAGDQVAIERVADFPNYIPAPHPAVAGNVRLSNPFRLVGVGDQFYVTDGGRNLVWRVDRPSGSVDTVVSFPPIPNPLFGIVPAGGPFLDAVPTAIARDGDELLVALFRGVPFPPGTSTVQRIYPTTGADVTQIAGLKTALDIDAVGTATGRDWLVLQFASAGPFFGGPGLVLRFAGGGGPPSVVASCLALPTSLTVDRARGRLLVSEEGGRLVSVPFTP